MKEETMTGIESFTGLVLGAFGGVARYFIREQRKEFSWSLLLPEMVIGTFTGFLFMELAVILAEHFTWAAGTWRFAACLGGVLGTKGLKMICLVLRRRLPELNEEDERHE